MQQEEKSLLLDTAKGRLIKTREIISKTLTQVSESVLALKADLTERMPKMRREDQILQETIIKANEQKKTNLHGMYGSPYFVRCTVRFEGDPDIKTFYFSKYSFQDEQIFSWTAPASILRFEEPGRFTYAVKEFGNKSGTLLAKEQYMISDGEIVYMTAEAVGQPRELVFQAYFSQRKTTFSLPEIVEQMEKAQDKVIRADPKGAFLISGPAGSGKTTLALHRAAYLLQSPDTGSYFETKEAIVFVQDLSSKSYFSQLLPELGIHNVQITTFPTWAREQLHLGEFGLTARYGKTETERDVYEFEKNKALQGADLPEYSEKTFDLLKKVYEQFFGEESMWLFYDQKQENVLDRFDLALLLKMYVHTHGSLHTEEMQLTQLVGGKVKRTVVKIPISYGLMILDEVQNFLPEQIRLLKVCVDPKYNSLVYVGDLAQQTQLCTLRNWADAGEVFGDERKVVLHKNYRSTRQILEYITSVGYEVEIPHGLKSGVAVSERLCQDKSEEIAYVLDLIVKNPTVLVGVLAKTKEYLVEFSDACKKFNNVHVVTINESQGVEFDVVCLVGVNESLVAIDKKLNPKLQEERKRVNKDLLYVALTRAMSELHVLGSRYLKDIL